MGIYEDVSLLQSQMAATQTAIEELQVSIGNTNYTPVAANSNLDDLTEGHYYISDYDTCITISNRPDTTGQSATIDVMKAGSTGQLIMIYRGCIKEYINIYVRTYYGDSWGAWLSFTGDTGWIDLPLNSGWSMDDYASEKPQYRKVGKVVYLRGLVNATQTAGVDIATLPEGFRPSEGWFNRWICPLNQNDNVIIQINANGVIKDHTKTTSQSRTFISLSGISFLTN